MSYSIRTRVASGGLALVTALAVAQEPLRPVASGASSSASTPSALAPSPLQDAGAGPSGARGRADDGAGPAPLRPTPLHPAEGIEPSVSALDLEAEIRDSLSLRDLDAREGAFDRWVARAADEPLVRRALESIAVHGADVDLAFTARLALREVDRAGRSVGASGARGGNVRDPFEEMRREMERVFGSDPFFTSPFAGRRGGAPLPDPFSGPFPRPFSGRDPFDRFDPFWRDPLDGRGDLQGRIDRMRAEIEEMLGQGRPGTGLAGPGDDPAGAASPWRSSGTSVEVTPSGVKVTITEQGAHGVESRTYEAPSFEELLEAHPELEGRIR